MNRLRAVLADLAQRWPDCLLFCTASFVIACGVVVIVGMVSERIGP